MPGRFVPHIETQRIVLQDPLTRLEYLRCIAEDIQNYALEDAQGLLSIYVEAREEYDSASKALLVSAGEVLTTLKGERVIAAERLSALVNELRRVEAEAKAPTTSKPLTSAIAA